MAEGNALGTLAELERLTASCSNESRNAALREQRPETLPLVPHTMQALDASHHLPRGERKAEANRVLAILCIVPQAPDGACTFATPQLEP